MLEYSCQFFHNCLSCYLSDEVERIQRQANCTSFFEILSIAVHRKKLGFQHFMTGKKNCHVIFSKAMYKYKEHKLASLLPHKNTNCRHILRSIRTCTTPVCKTDWFEKSFMISHSPKMWTIIFQIFTLLVNFFFNS